MVIFESEKELIEYLDKHDDLVREGKNTGSGLDIGQSH
jgi:hypothetical protein